MTKFKCNHSIINIAIIVLAILASLALLNYLYSKTRKTIESLDTPIIENAAIFCTADYGADSSKAKKGNICPQTQPICNQYVPGKFMGTCGYKKSPNKNIDFVFTEPRPPPPAKPCTWIAKGANFDYTGNDLESFANISLEDCKKKCQDNQGNGCKGIVYDSAAKKCYLKKELGMPTSKANLQGFIVSPGCPPPLILPPLPKKNCCVGWQQTLNCLGTGPADTSSSYLKSSTEGSKLCSTTIPSGASGYCTCKDGKKLLYNCGHKTFNCEDACAEKNCRPSQLAALNNPLNPS
jgi:hypothetical protein